MSAEIEKISQITIYLKDSALAQKVGEVALFDPLSKRSAFDEESQALRSRTWTFHHHLSFKSRLFLKIGSFFFHHIKFFIPKVRKTAEAKFKTTVAILLAQESLREFFLGTPEKQQTFFAALQKGSKVCGYYFSPPQGDSVLQIARELTTLTAHTTSLIDDLVQLNLQMAALTVVERNEILFAVLDAIERPPVTSVIEIEALEKTQEIELTTQYAKVQIHSIDSVTGWIDVTCEKNRATSSIETLSHLLPGAKGVVNQRRVLEIKEGEAPLLLGCYCGQMGTVHHLLEQILFILQEESALQAFFVQETETAFEEKKILFTSLFSWNEYEKILAQHTAIEALHGKRVQIRCKDGTLKTFHLSLYHQNLSFNAWNKFPTPAELKANLRDLNDEMLLPLVSQFFPQEPKLEKLANELERCRQEKDYLARREGLQRVIDAFRALKKEMVPLLAASKEEAAIALHTLVEKRRPDGQKLTQMDALIYTGVVTRSLGILHNKNCEHGMDRSSGANAADKAQNAFFKIRNTSFLPGLETEEEGRLFQVLYSMYLVWEEPELNAGLSVGFIGEKFFKNFIQKNLETTRYLTSWLKHHPEVYLGLSDYRH